MVEVALAPGVDAAEAAGGFVLWGLTLGIVEELLLRAGLIAARL